MLHIRGVHLTEKRIIIALDFPTAAAAEQFLSGLDPASCRVKIGKELFTAAGPDFVRRVVLRSCSGKWCITGDFRMVS